MSSLIQQLEQNYVERSSNKSMFRDTWNKVCAEFPPVAEFDYNSNIFPSTRLAKEAGDMGLAILWVVQFSLFRCIIKDTIGLMDQDHPIFSRIRSLEDNSIGAMAHTEPRDNRLIIKRDDSSVVLNGTKRYISGGLDADILLVTGRYPGDEQYTKMIFMPVESLPEGSLLSQDLEILNTISHGTLTLDDFQCHSEYLFPVKGKALRKILKRWSMIERTLIVEAYIGFMHYIASACSQSEEVCGQMDDLRELIDFHQSFSRQQMQNAWNGEFVETGGDMAKILGITQTLVHYISHNNQALPPEVVARARDLQLFNKLRV